MYNIAICDDEPLAAQLNQDMVCRIMEAKGLRRNTDFTLNVFSKSEKIQKRLTGEPSAYHLLLLDIKLEGENGLILASSLREMGVDCSIVYITAYRDYVFDSFESHPLHYLLKPVDETKLANVIFNDYQENYRPEQIVLPIDGQWRPLSTHNILYGEASLHKSAVHLSAETIYLKMSFSELLSRLTSSNYCRCHHSIIVNLEHVRKLNRGNLLLDNGTELPVSRTYQQEVRKNFIAYIKMSAL